MFFFVCTGDILVCTGSQVVPISPQNPAVVVARRHKDLRAREKKANRVNPLYTFLWS